jgi:hypothetical protein
LIVKVPPVSSLVWAVIDLKLHPGREKFVSDNAISIAEAYVEPTFVPLAVYAGEPLVSLRLADRQTGRDP